MRARGQCRDMTPTRLRDREAIEAFLRRDRALHVYELGDLDPFFWPHTTWYALGSPPDLRQLVLLYTASELPVILGLTRSPVAELAEFVRTLTRHLPARFYAHLTDGVPALLGDGVRLDSRGLHRKMALRDPSRLADLADPDAVVLGDAHLQEIRELYARSYPGNWFEPRMLETGKYFGRREHGRLVSLAGVHVYSERYRVAALGNITTDPAHRGRGLAARVTAALCTDLLRTVDVIGLNVKATNEAALTCYRGLGFDVIADYEELMIENLAAAPFENLARGE